MEVLEKPRQKTRKKSDKNLSKSENNEKNENIGSSASSSNCDPTKVSNNVQNYAENEVSYNETSVIREDNKDADNISLTLDNDKENIDNVPNNEKTDQTENEIKSVEINLSIADVSLPKDSSKNISFRELKQDLDKIEQMNLSLPNISEHIHVKTVPMATEEVKIRPYTEQQLSALYTNSELNTMEQFTLEFIEAELKGTAIKHHPLYELLSSYLQERSKLSGNKSELRHQRIDYQEMLKHLWTEQSSVVKATAQCGDGLTVMATHTYTKATFHRSAFQSIIIMLNKIYLLTTESHTLFSFSAQVLKLQIDNYVHEVVNNIVKATELNPKAPIYLGMNAPPAQLMPLLSELRLCISILFQFQRRLITDKEFIKETRSWLSELIFLLVRLATWQDHLFIINHILRCPGGIGNWASRFIQAPLGNIQDSPFSNYEINHIVALLALILTPVQKRDAFLEEFSQQKEGCVDALWIMVDSEGEEDEETSGTGLRENDLVSLLNQLPLDNLFRSILLVPRSNKDYYDGSQLTEHHILRYFSFSTNILKLLHKGLQTYNHARYHQFCKRLCRFIRHIVEYSTDIWEIFQSRNQNCDQAMMLRLQVEYDAFFLRAIYYLYIGEKLGAWQFLAVVPFGKIANHTLWKIYYFLHQLDYEAQTILDPENETDYNDKIWEADFREQFEEKLNSLAASECYYLLNTFSNMALARTFEDMEFIQTAAMDLLHIGFVSETTQELCSKNARNLLTHITSRYPHLLSTILKAVKDEMDKIGDLCLFLYEELPISVWKLTDKDLDIISNWLLKNNVIANESKLARMILSRLNWELVHDGELFLPYSTHCQVALLIAQAVMVDQAYSHWTWQTAFRLRLHINDKGFVNFENVKDIQNYNVILKGVREQSSLCSFLSLLLSSWGHLIPQVCTKGMEQLIFLLSQQKYEAVLFSLNLIVPLFIDCQESLVNSDKFQTILLGLLNIDRTYINMAKTLVSTQASVLEQFGNMIESQIANYQWYGLETPRYLVRLWINSLVSIQNWNRDNSVMYLLDVIIRASFFHSDAIDVIVGILRDLLQCVTPQEQSNSIITVFKWVSQSNSSQNTLLINSTLSAYPYLAYLMISLEFEEREKSTGLWKEILIQLKLQKGKVNVDAAIRKASTKLKLPSFSSGSLCFFRWAQQALDTPIDHPILVLFWQKFFCLYLYRFPLIGNNDYSCAGNRFFEGMINLNFFKRLKNRLAETVDFYKGKTIENDFSQLPAARQLYYINALRLFSAYSVWLDDPRVQDSSLHLPGLPPQYEPQLLSLVLQCNDSPWMESVDYEQIKNDQKSCIKLWRQANYRERKNINQPLLNAGKRVESEDPLERITRRLSSYDAPKEADFVSIQDTVISKVDITNKFTMFKSLDSNFKTLLHYAHSHLLNSSAHKSLDCTYQELVPQLYRTVTNNVKKSVRCSGSTKNSCISPGIVLLKADEARINDHIDVQIQQNRRDFEALLSKVLQASSQSLCLSAVSLQQVIRLLQNDRLINPARSELGVELFYYLLTLLNEETLNFLPTKKLFSECLEKLGQSHINGIEFETPKLLSRILEDPGKGIFLAPHFSPTNVGVANFIAMYSMIVNGVQHEADLLYSLLSKFDVNKWLNRCNPKLSQRSQFIELIIKALLKLGQQPTDNCLVLHEVYRKHLISIFQYQFPEHYGEILIHVLKASNGSESDCIAISVWMDILNSLSNPIEIQLNVPMRDQLRLFAHQQKVLNYQELLDTSILLSRHFTNERMQYGLYGLYPKMRHYVDVMVLFLGMTGHSLVISAVNVHQGVLGDELCEKIWPYLRDMFTPWIVPYWTNNVKENMATWIQQLTDDRAALLPWIPANAPFAQKIVNVFFECILFIIQTLPACNNILSFIWQWYVMNFAHAPIKEHVLNVIHNSFQSLPWQKFWPTVTDVEYMLKVIEQYLPECHTFLGLVFMEVPWKLWINSLSKNTAHQIKCRIYHCLLNLIIKLSIEPNVRLNSVTKLENLLEQAETFDWSSLEPNSVQQAVDWYVMSCDPQVLIKTDNTLDKKVVQFLKEVCFLTKPLSSNDAKSLQKRHIFVRGYVKLIHVLTTKYKNQVASKETELINSVSAEVTNLENTVKTQEEFNVILGEMLALLNFANIKNAMLKYFVDWIKSREGDSIALNAVLNVLGGSVSDADCVAILYEECIDTYFNNNVSNLETLSWEHVCQSITTCYPKQSILIEALITKGCILTLHVLLLDKISKSQETSMILNLSLQWLSNIKVSELVESKIPLLWGDILRLCIKYCDEDEASAGTYLYKFGYSLLQMSEQKDANKWGGLLGAIGIGKQNSITLRFRFLSKALAGYVLAQLPDTKGNLHTVRKSPNAPCTVGQTGGNSEVAKVLLKLDFGQTQGKIKECAEQALKQIQDPQNSIHNVGTFLRTFLHQFYTNPYLKEVI